MTPPGWLLLSLAIAGEVAGTLLLRASDGLANRVASLAAFASYLVAFHLLALALKTIPVSVTYAIWAGIGTVGAAVGGVVVFHERLTAWSMAGIAMILAGVVIVELTLEA